MELVSPAMCSFWFLFSVILKILVLFLTLTSFKSSLCLQSLKSMIHQSYTQSLWTYKPSIFYYWFCMWVHSKFKGFLSYPSVYFLLGSLGYTLHKCVHHGYLHMVDQMVKKLPVTQEVQVWSLGQEDPLEKGMATLSSVLT